MIRILFSGWADVCIGPIFRCPWAANCPASCDAWLLDDWVRWRTINERPTGYPIFLSLVANVFRNSQLFYKGQTRNSVMRLEIKTQNLCSLSGLSRGFSPRTEYEWGAGIVNKLIGCGSYATGDSCLAFMAAYEKLKMQETPNDLPNQMCNISPKFTPV